jgi:integrase
MSALAQAQVFNIRNTDVQEVYKAFLSSHYRNSPRTAEEYDARVREFFKLILGKNIEYVTLEDIQSIKNKDVQTKFVDELIKRGNSTSTIRTKLNSVKSFYDDLLKNELQVNPMALKVKMKVNVKHHESLTIDEYFELLEFLKTEDDGLEKYLLTKTLFHTGNRKTATINMTWNNIVRKRDVVIGENVWVIQVMDKGQKPVEKPISDEFYEELQQLNNGQEKVFPVLSRQGAYKRYERSLKKYGKMIGKDISIHTLKATAITIAYQMTKDINLCKQLGSHSSIATTEIYIKDEKSYVNQLSYVMSKKLDESILDKMSHEELLKFIKDNEDIKRMILMRLSIN